MAIADFEYIDVDTHVIGLADAKAQLHWMEHALDDMNSVLEDIVADIHRQTLAQFVSEGSALGDPWDQLDPTTVADKTRSEDAFPEWPLVATGAMMDSATSQTGPFSVGDVLEHQAWLGLDWDRDGWNIPLLHQLGVPETLVRRRAYTRHDGTHVAATSYLWHLPARPFWKATDALADEGADHIARWVMFG